MTIRPGIPGEVMVAYSEGFPCGLTGVLGITIEDGDGNEIVPRTTANILQLACVDDVATYSYTGVYPGDPALSPYLITWDDTDQLATEEILVEAGPSGGGGVGGPCSDWITGDDVAACCNVESSSGALFDDAADQASQLLFALSGRQFAGLCQRTVRPACDSCFCGYQILSRGTPNLENELWAVSANVLNGSQTPEAAAEQLQKGLDGWYKPAQ